MKSQNLKPYFLGILAALGALAIEVVASLLISPGKYFFEQASISLFLMLLASSVIEEAFKYLMIWKNSENILNKGKIVLDSLRIGVGFGLTEFALKNAYREESVLFFAALAVILHILTSLFMGLTFPKNLRPTFLYSALIILIASLAHFAYNLAILYF